MRIAIFHNLPSGGAKRTLLEATKTLVRSHHVDAYSLSSADHEFCDIRQLVECHRVFDFVPGSLFESPLGRLNQAVRIADLMRLRGVARRVARAIDDAGYDVALVEPCRFEQAPSVLSFLRRTPSVYYCHEPPRAVYERMPPRPYDRQTRLRRSLNRMDPLPAVYRRTLRSVDRGNTRKAGAVLVNSRYSAGVARCTYGVTAVVTFHGVDVERFRPLSVAKGNTVLSVGSLTPLKGFDFLVRAIGLLPPASRPVLVLASNFENPPERVHLQNLAREEGVDVEVRGQVDDCDLVRLYNAARMVAYAPVREPFGLVPLEAMACATPVVAVAEGGVPETIVDGVTGFLVDRDPSQFAGAAKRLMDQPHVGRRLGENGREHVLASWTWDRAVQSLAARLEAAASARTVADA